MAHAWIGARILRRIEDNALKTPFLRDASNPIEDLSNERVKLWFRFEKQSIYDLCRVLSKSLKRPTFRKCSLPVIYQVLVVLRFLASGSYYHVYEGQRWMSK